MNAKKNKKTSCIKKKKIKLIIYIIVYVLLMLLLSSLLFSVVSDNKNSKNTSSITGSIQELIVNHNGSKNPIDLLFKINDQLYILSWNSASSYANAVEELKKEKKVTIEFYKTVSWKGERYNRIVDLRSDTKIYYNIKHSSTISTFALVIVIILFILFSIIFTFFFIVYVISIRR